MSAQIEAGELRRDALPRSDPLRLSRVSFVAAKLAAICALFLVAMAIGLGLYAFAHNGRIYEGVSGGNLDLGGMTPAEARMALSAEAATYLSQPVPLTYEGKTFTLVPSASGVSLNVDGTIDEAMAIGRTGSVWSRSRIWARSLFRGADSRLVLSVDQQAFQSAIARLAPNVVSAPSDAYVDMSSSSGPAIVPERSGIGFDAGSTGAALLNRLSIEGTGAVVIVASVVDAPITAASLESSLTPAQAVVAEPLTLNAVGRQWTIASDELRKIVTVNPSDNSVNIDSASISGVISDIASQINASAQNAQLYVNSGGALEVVPGHPSVKVDVKATTEAVLSALGAGRHSLDVVVAQASPKISDQQANDAKAKAEALISGGIALSWSGGKQTLTPAQLLAAITIDTNAKSNPPFTMGFSPEVITTFLQPIADSIDVTGKDATFRIVNGKVKAMSDAVPGKTLELQKSVDGVIGAVMGGTTNYSLVLSDFKPKYTAADASKISVPDLLADGATDYSTATDAKRTNIDIAAGLENGWLVEPGGVFSYDDVIGPVDTKQGFVTGLGILADPTTGGITTGPVVGGGICQVSTTIFQAAFWAGMDVVQRNTHPYWIHTYGAPPHGMIGLDAMVDVETTGSLDMQFKNTTGHWIAVVVTADDTTLTAKIMGTATGWSVDVQQPVISNYVDPDPGTIYTDSPELPSGTQEQVESASQGFDASIRRIITDKSGKVIDDSTLTGTYVPSRDRVLVGTGAAS